MATAIVAAPAASASAPKTEGELMKTAPADAVAKPAAPSPSAAS